jgi:hypothetical protein
MKAEDLWLHRALRLAGEVFIADTGEEPLPREVVMRSLVDACDTIRRLPDQERGWLYSMRTLWPEVVRDRQDDHEAYEAMLARINSGEESADVLLPVRRISSAAVSRMMAVTETYPHLLVGRDRRRDWTILTMLARGYDGKVTARAARCHKNTVYDRRDLQLSRLAEELGKKFPGVFDFSVVMALSQRKSAS